MEQRNKHLHFGSNLLRNLTFLWFASFCFLLLFVSQSWAAVPKVATGVDHTAVILSDGTLDLGRQHSGRGENDEYPVTPFRWGRTRTGDVTAGVSHHCIEIGRHAQAWESTSMAHLEMDRRVGLFRIGTRLGCFSRE
jgi:hypothetical protein